MPDHDGEADDLFTATDVRAAFEEAGVPLEHIYDEHGEPLQRSFVGWTGPGLVEPGVHVEVVRSTEAARRRQMIVLGAPSRDLDKTTLQNVIVFLATEDVAIRDRVDQALRVLAKGGRGRWGSRRRL